MNNRKILKYVLITLVIGALVGLLVVMIVSMVEAEARRKEIVNSVMGELNDEIAVLGDDFKDDINDIMYGTK